MADDDSNFLLVRQNQREQVVRELPSKMVTLKEVELFTCVRCFFKKTCGLCRFLKVVCLNWITAHNRTNNKSTSDEMIKTQWISNFIAKQLSFNSVCRVFCKRRTLKQGNSHVWHQPVCCMLEILKYLNGTTVLVGTVIMQFTSIAPKHYLP